MHEFSNAISNIYAVEFETKKLDANIFPFIILDIGSISGIEFYTLDTAI
ncbi:MAG: hypothetical protein P8I80_05845 [Bacteroidales bacterium]|jgi:Zn finger protein HypA/HybF involved in hydrogenase expression|nr:hypothetical protein [Bacteroidales bacterium]MDG2081764.1 hypothetical protein [Bacteroidales bacterium]|tara:strand:+ start:1682 stop:1828 length:147 start_codon:yes stop_codon:yes gene_type:complete